ncbi:MAG TPA: tripartite tricarboxylate transporter TctB family protein [Ramlibacter sp.]|nr:tripartite tricarboxylate transporter TctB family protein [Ramlibacter sp.]
MLKSVAIRNQKNFAAGVLYIAAGSTFAAGALFYKMGSAARMGPGYFPFWLGLLLAAIGVVVLAGSLRARAPADALPKLDWQVLAWIVASVVLFGLLLTRAGLVISLATLVLVSSRASHEFKWKGAVLNALLLLAMCLGAFVFGLGLQLPLWPSFIE